MEKYITTNVQILFNKYQISQLYCKMSFGNSCLLSLKVQKPFNLYIKLDI